MTQDITESIDSKRTDRFGRIFIMTISVLTFAMLIGGVYFATAFDRGDGLSTYEREDISVVAMQNDISQAWNETVDTFNAASVLSQNDHIVLAGTLLMYLRNTSHRTTLVLRQ
jgi:hypothetical protein